MGNDRIAKEGTEGNINKRSKFFLDNIVWDEHLFIDDVHQSHVCQHKSCVANRVFENSLREQGSYALAKKINRIENYRLYDRKYPYDSASKAIPIDAIADTHGYEQDLEGKMIADQSREAFLASLTPGMREVAEYTEAGYKPREIASKLGKKDSGSIRWQKHMVKRRAQENYDD